MPRLAYVNGRMLPLSAARISVEDRGFLFGDGIYEVAGVFDGKLFDWPLHLERLARSLRELEIAPPMGEAALTAVVKRLIARNRLKTGTVYIEITRGAAPREHGFPVAAVPGLVMWAKPFDFASRIAMQAKGVRAVTAPDQRWGRRDIKSVNLLANVLAKQQGKRDGAYETIMIAEDGTVTEGSSTSVWIVDGDGQVLTRPLSNAILPGLKRRRLIALLEGDGVSVMQRSFSETELRTAAEIFVTSTSSPVMPVISLDGKPVGNGRPGPVGQRACALLWDEIARQTGWRAGSAEAA